MSDDIADICNAGQSATSSHRPGSSMRTNRHLAIVVLLGSSWLLTDCRDQQLSYSLQPGAVDRQPAEFWGPEEPDIPPHPNDPVKAVGLQQYADQLIGSRVAEFTGYRWDMSLLSGQSWTTFFTLAEPGSGPGMCASRQYVIPTTFKDGKALKSSDGKWSGTVYSIAGSVAPMSEPLSDEYKRRLMQACRQRSDMEMWFWAEPHDAYLAARLSDAVISTAKESGRMPFILSCRPYPSDAPVKPGCVRNVRASVASINSRAIIEVGKCHDPETQDCLAVQFPKQPKRESKIEDRWTLNVHFEPRQGTIRKVVVEDTQIIID